MMRSKISILALATGQCLSVLPDHDGSKTILALGKGGKVMASVWSMLITSAGQSQQTQITDLTNRYSRQQPETGVKRGKICNAFQAGEAMNMQRVLRAEKHAKAYKHEKTCNGF